MDDEILQIFFGKDNEPITEELIAELVAQGMPEKDIRQMAKDGFTYCRARNSFMSPPEFEGEMFSGLTKRAADAPRAHPKKQRRRAAHR